MDKLLKILDKAAISNGGSRKRRGGGSPSRRDRGETSPSAQRHRRVTFPSRRCRLTTDYPPQRTTSAAAPTTPKVPSIGSAVTTMSEAADEEDFVAPVVSTTTEQASGGTQQQQRRLDPFISSSMSAEERYESMPCGMPQLLERVENAGQTSCSNRSLDWSTSEAQQARRAPDYDEKPIEHRPYHHSLSRRDSALLLTAEPWADGTLFAPGGPASFSKESENNKQQEDDINSWYEDSDDEEDDLEDVGLHISRHVYNLNLVLPQ